ncbi:MAG: indole-3-glycerol phosphate synthase TrpC [Schwartzia sp.]|nr:indole-3-glycerol phosphate synthase TrpC [Schwartzia sp. (in: firmicutes)]MBR1760428.1 indole-3-glycerol phosphate synthase TrpC [Schwartzia sp. (in: firmicutes)]
MRNILAEIVEKKKEIVAAAKKVMPLDEVKRAARPGGFRLSHRVRKEAWSLIAECKLQSPAKGRLCRAYSVTELAKIYEESGASALSVHTDPHFLGSNEDFAAVRKMTDLPMLRKDFIIDEYQIYEARMLGADAVLLIARILSPRRLMEFLYLAWGLGMDALVEVHDETDLKMALDTPAEFIGVNNRNLTTFTTSLENTMALLPNIGEGRTVISESGVQNAEDAERLREAGCDGILVGEGLVTAPNVAEMTRRLSFAAGAARKSA